jgi:hypothetical protein
MIETLMTKCYLDFRDSRGRYQSIKFCSKGLEQSPKEMEAIEDIEVPHILYRTCCNKSYTAHPVCY